MAYLMKADLYECDFCGFQERWDAHDDYRGDIWECECCGIHFCTKCFTEKLGKEAFDKMLKETDYVICAGCYENRYLKNDDREDLHGNE